MSYAEMFLMVWAVTATILCGFTYSALKRALRALVGGAELVRDIAKGEATVTIHKTDTGERLEVHRKGENHGV